MEKFTNSKTWMTTGKAVNFTVTEALTFGYVDIIDILVEIFGKMIPQHPNNFSWTHHFHYELKIVKAPS